MLFNSLGFIFVFLPLVLLIALRLRGQKLLGWLCLASCVFYASAGHVWFLGPMIIATVSDFLLAKRIQKAKKLSEKRLYVFLAMAITLGLLGYFKYASFFYENISLMFSKVFGVSLPQNLKFLAGVILPAGISFYSFQAISYILDVYNEACEAETDFLKFMTFIIFFPHLVAGPLTRHNQLIPQLDAISKSGPRPQYISGISLFVLGLAKKVLVADRIANLVDPLLINPHNLGVTSAWLTMVGYGLQIYFDFSGYTDMAIGLGRLFGIEFPQNFNRPYLATSPADYWRRWHITLSNWLRDYVFAYVALTGWARDSHLRQHLNIVITMFLGGLWHGANWTFICWGTYHGILIAIFQAYRKPWSRMPHALQVGLTCFLVTISWAFFRSPNIEFAFAWLKAAIGYNQHSQQFASWPLVVVSAVALFIIFLAPTANAIAQKEKLSVPVQIGLGILAMGAILMMNYSSRFLYFQF